MASTLNLGPKYAMLPLEQTAPLCKRSSWPSFRTLFNSSITCPPPRRCPGPVGAKDLRGVLYAQCCYLPMYEVTAVRSSILSIYVAITTWGVWFPKCQAHTLIWASTSAGYCWPVRNSRSPWTCHRSPECLRISDMEPHETSDQQECFHLLTAAISSGCCWNHVNQEL